MSDSRYAKSQGTHLKNGRKLEYNFPFLFITKVRSGMKNREKHVCEMCVKLEYNFPFLSVVKVNESTYGKLPRTHLENTFKLREI